MKPQHLLFLAMLPLVFALASCGQGLPDDGTSSSSSSSRSFSVSISYPSSSSLSSSSRSSSSSRASSVASSRSSSFQSSFASSTDSSASSQSYTESGCKIGGCSNHVCVDEDAEDVITTCEWTEAYACYQTARCERQSNGRCGWTQTAALRACLENAR